MMQEEPRAQAEQGWVWDWSPTSVEYWWRFPPATRRERIAAWFRRVVLRKPPAPPTLPFFTVEYGEAVRRRDQ